MASGERRAVAAIYAAKSAENPAFTRAWRVVNHRPWPMVFCGLLACIPGLWRAFCLTIGWLPGLRADGIILLIWLITLPQQLIIILRGQQANVKGWQRLWPAGTLLFWQGVVLGAGIFAAGQWLLGLLESLPLPNQTVDYTTLPLLGLVGLVLAVFVLPAAACGSMGIRFLHQIFPLMRRRRLAFSWSWAGAGIVIAAMVLGLFVLPLIYGLASGCDPADIGGTVADILSLPVAVFGIYFAMVVATLAAEPPAVI